MKRFVCCVLSYPQRTGSWIIKKSLSVNIAVLFSLRIRHHVSPKLEYTLSLHSPKPSVTSQRESRITNKYTLSFQPHNLIVNFIGRYRPIFAFVVCRRPVPEYFRVKLLVCSTVTSSLQLDNMRQADAIEVSNRVASESDTVCS